MENIPFYVKKENTITQSKILLPLDNIVWAHFGASWDTHTIYPSVIFYTYNKIYFLQLSNKIPSSDANTQVLKNKSQQHSLTPFLKTVHAYEEMPGLQEWISHRISELQVT